jgi:hypothetical protein
MTLRIVSYAYFRSPTSIYEKIKGDAAIQFEQFLSMLVRAHWCVWRGWSMRIHIDDHIKTLPYYKTLCRMAATELAYRFEDDPLRVATLIDLVHCGPAKPLCQSMLWRMTPVFQGQDKIVLCRDVDSVPMPRDRICVEEWIKSPHAVHVIHDASPHSGVMGGTLGVKTHRFQDLLGCHSMEEFLAHGQDLQWEQQGADQHLLNRLLPKYASQTLVHDLHHRVNDMGPVDVRERAELPTARELCDMFPYLSPNQAATANGLCSIIGGCTDPEGALKFYDSIDSPERDLIRACER